MELASHLDSLPYYRPIWPQERTDAKPVLICFEIRDLKRAMSWARENLPRKTLDIHLQDAPSLKIRLKYRLKGIRVSALRPDHDYSNRQVILFRRQTRKLGRRLAQLGVRFFHFAEDPGYRAVKFSETYLADYGAPLQQLCDLLEDDESREILSACVKYRITGDHGWLRISDFAEYEHPLVRPEPGEWVMDCGAANGATSLRFAEMVGPTGRVFAVEPDPANHERIEETLGPQAVPTNTAEVRILPCGLSDTPGVAAFSPDGGSGEICDTGDLEIRLDTIDNLAQANDLAGPGTISLDVEGFERAALEGGLDTIRRLRPKLQVSIYHKERDLFELGLWLSEELTDYAFFMGHHDTSHCETDLYAIPREHLDGR